MTETSNFKELLKCCNLSITKMDVSQALDHIGKLIDDSSDASFERGAKRALFLLDELSKRTLIDAEGALIEYFRANAWSTLSHIRGIGRSWSWEAPELLEQLLALSRATSHLGFEKLDKLRRCQIITNRANHLNTIGRSIDAIAGWDEALRIIPSFAKARGNRGHGLKCLAVLTSNHRHRAILALHAYEGLVSATTEDALFESGDREAVVTAFIEQAIELSRAVDIEAVRRFQHLKYGNLGRSKTEQGYRRWCLERRLFLCSLNDLGPYTAAAVDDIMLPALSEGWNDRPDDHLPPAIFGFFNQLKQEYVSARFTLFEGISGKHLHFSDRHVPLTDMLDYSHYSLASERVRTAFRIGYSLLDKIACLIDHYWCLNKDPKTISFKNVWMVQDKQRLLPIFESYANLPLRGLYWLSKELFDDKLKKTTAADATELNAIRNALEHTYLRVIEGWARPFEIRKTNGSGPSVEVGSDQLEAKAIRIMQIARSALFYFSHAIHLEELKKRSCGSEKITIPMPLFNLKDARKQRDPS